MDKQWRYSYFIVMIMCIFQRHFQLDPMVLGLSLGHIHICLNNGNYTTEFPTIRINVIHLYIVHWRMYSWAIRMCKILMVVIVFFECVLNNSTFLGCAATYLPLSWFLVCKDFLTCHMLWIYAITQYDNNSDLKLPLWIEIFCDD